MTDRALSKLPRNDRPHKLDVLGAALMVAAALSLMLAMTWGGTRYRLDVVADPRAAVGGSVVLWLLFALRLLHRARAVHPARRAARADGAARSPWPASSRRHVIIGLSIFLPLYFELVLGDSRRAARAPR